MPANNQTVVRRPRTGRDPKVKRILFHAINGNGLGHLVRLFSHRASLQNRAEIAFFSTCAFASEYWPGKIFGVSDRLDDRFELSPSNEIGLPFISR